MLKKQPQPIVKVSCFAMVGWIGDVELQIKRAAVYYCIYISIQTGEHQLRLPN